MVKYRNIPMSQQFLTGMMAQVFPSVINLSPPVENLQWDSVPYTPEHIKKALITPGSRGDSESQFSKDYNRSTWFFGERMVSEKTLSIPEKPELKSDHDRLIEYTSTQLQEASISSGVKLSPEESQALLAYHVSVGDAVVLQGGSIRGISANYFATWWMKMGLKLIFCQKGDNESEDEDPCRYEENQRVRRMADGRLLVSSCIESARMLDQDTGQILESEDKEEPRVIKFSSEQIIEHGRDAESRPVFMRKPYQQKLQIEEKFWKNHMVKKAQNILSEIESFSFQNTYMLIPFLADAGFRDQFFNKLAKRPQGEYDEMVKWMRVCQGSARTSVLLGIDRVRNFINVNPSRALVIVAGIGLCIIGAALAATGVLAPVGVALGFAGASMAAPGAVAAVAAVCLAAPAVVYALGVGLVKLARKLFTSPAPVNKDQDNLPPPSPTASTTHSRSRSISKDFSAEGKPVIKEDIQAASRSPSPKSVHSKRSHNHSHSFHGSPKKRINTEEEKSTHKVHDPRPGPRRNS